jgi:hypothetical protein
MTSDFLATSGRSLLEAIFYGASHANRKDVHVLRLRLGKLRNQEELIGSPSLRMTEFFKYEFTN